MSDGAPVRLTMCTDSKEFGGAEVYLLHLLRHLPTRFRVTLLATDTAPLRLLDAARGAGARVAVVAPVRSKRDVGRMLQLARALAATRADVVHVIQATPANNRHAIAVAAALRRRTVATLHLTAPVQSARHRTVLRALYARPRRVIAVSSQTRAQLCDELHVPAERVRVVGNGVEVRDAQPVVARTPPSVGGMGRLVAQKGFDVLVTAVRLLHAEGLVLDVRVAGEGVEAERLRAAAGGLPITWLPFTDDVDAFLGELDVFVMPSRWEGLPFALLEAMMRGLPCVASDVGDVRQAMGDAGVVVAPDDPHALAAALRGLAGDAARRRALGAAAHARAVADHSVDSMVAQTVAVYEEVLSG